MKQRLKSLALGLTAALLYAGSARAETLEVEVSGLRSARGALRADVYAPPRRHVAKQTAAAATGGLRLRFEGLPPGDYAVLMYHDENGNGRLDTGGPLRLPVEGYAFSRDARARLGIPSFERMRVTVPASGSATTRAVVRYR